MMDERNNEQYDDDDEGFADYDARRERREQEIIEECVCGAIQWVEGEGYITVADCCCPPLL